MSRGTQAIINLKNLKHNFKVLNQLAPSELILVVKADAYGHGLKQIVKTLKDAYCFAVATIDEALIIRKIRPNIKILLLEGFLNQDELQIALDNNFDSVIHQQQQIQLLDSLQQPNKINIWLKYDSGMNRLGFTQEQFKSAVTHLEEHSHVKELVLMSHLASANLRQNLFTKQQSERFLQLANNQQLSLSNSSALLTSNYLQNEWCRVGLSLFGISPIEGTTADDFNLKPVMTLKTNIIAIKQISSGESIGYSQTFIAENVMKIAIIGIGYGDGYPWNIKKNAYVKLNNQKVNIVGRVSMDMLAIDITELSDVDVGNSVLIWGENNNSLLPVENVAQNAYSIPYVLVCQITSRVHYSYV